MARRQHVLAYHIVFGAYGFWLPNDPRGSWSVYVGGRDLYDFGRATKTVARYSVARRRHDHQRRLAAKVSLKHEAVSFTGLQARAVARGIAHAANESQYVIHACAVMPNHVHLVVARHHRDVRRIANHLKARATQRLMEERLWPDVGKPVWARNGWQVFLLSPEDVTRAIRYVEQNPLRDGKRRQNWPFVVPFVPPV